MSVLEAQVDNKILIVKAIDNGDGTATLALGATLVASDIQIGAVEIKNGITDDRASVDTEGQLNTVTPNRTNWAVRSLDTGLANTETPAGAFAVPDGFGVSVIADTANTDEVRVGAVGETGVSATRFVLQPGDSLPITLKVTNMSAIAAQSPTANQFLKLIVERV